MSRGKKLPKAEKKHRRQQRDRRVEHELELLRRDIVDLSHSDTAAANLVGPCEDRLVDLKIDTDLIEATLQLWRRAAPDHAFTANLAQLAEEYRRHAAALDEIVDQLVMHAEPESESEVGSVEPTASEKTAIATAILGADMAQHADV